MLYESSGPPDCEGLPFHDCFKPIPPAVRSLYSPSRFAALAVNVRNASEMRRWVDGFLEVRCEGRWHDRFARLLCAHRDVGVYVFRMACQAGYGTMCLLGVAAREYTQLPLFWEEQVAYLAAKSRSPSAPSITFRAPRLVGRSNDTMFWIPNTQVQITARVMLILLLLCRVCSSRVTVPHHSRVGWDPSSCQPRSDHHRRY
jgi:hypothetical protein